MPLTTINKPGWQASEVGWHGLSGPHSDPVRIVTFVVTLPLTYYEEFVRQHDYGLSNHPPLGERIEFSNEYHPWREGAPLRYGTRFRN